jgi:hypothetical protein
MPYNFVLSYQDDGIAQTWSDVYSHTPQGIQPGDLMRKDLNGDGRIDDNDRVALQDSRDRPLTSFSLNAFASWKGFDLSMLWTGTGGRKDFWLNAFNSPNFGTSRYAVNQMDVDNPWSVENRDGTWPRLGGSGNNTSQTSFWLYDMTYLRLKNIQVGYSFPKPLFQKLGVTNFRIAGSAENLVTLSNYPGLDPEKAGNNNNIYPIIKSYSVAVQLSF